MSYRIEGTDIVIDGFQGGIAPSPYDGIADIRNIDITNVDGEASVNFAMGDVTAPVVANAIAFTAQNSGDTITISSTTGWYKGMAIVLNTNSAGGLSTGIVYYVMNIVGNTFQLSLAPIGSAVAISGDGSGTLTTYQYGYQRGTGGSGARAPVAYFIDRAGQLAGVNATYLVDGSNYAWAILAEDLSGISANYLVFLGNIGGIGAATTNQAGIAIWNDYLLLYGGTTVDVADLDALFITGGPAAEWSYSWQTAVGIVSVNNRVNMLVSQDDGNLYWTSTDGLGSIIEQPGMTFDPSTAGTYSFADDALILGSGNTDRATCIAELGNNLIVGGRSSFVYVWNKVDPGVSGLLNMPDVFTTNIVATSNNAYVFAGVRGNIFVTNGSGIDEYTKFPDYLTGIVRPYIQWFDASFNRDELYFSLVAYDNGNTVQTTTNGAWAINLRTDALRMMNKSTNSTYAGYARMVAEMPRPSSSSTASNVPGTGLFIGWYNSTTYKVDKGISTPYASYESYVETDMVPVGTYLDTFTPTQIEWKMSYPLGGGGTAESIRIYYRRSLLEAWTLLGSTTATGTSIVGTSTGTTSGSAISDFYTANFERSQWIQLRVETSSNATTPSYCRLTEIRIRDFPNSNKK